MSYRLSFTRTDGAPLPYAVCVKGLSTRQGVAYGTGRFAVYHVLTVAWRLSRT